MKTKLTIAAVLIMVVGFFVVDAVIGTPAKLHGVVVDKERVNPSFRVNSDGTVTTTDGKQYIIVRTDIGISRVSVSTGYYELMKHKDECVLNGRFGKFTKHFYSINITEE